MMTTDDEKRILNHLIMAWDGFVALDDKHPDDVTEFRHHLHGLQCLIAWRVARRADGKTWGKPERNPTDERREKTINLILAKTTIRRSTLEGLSDVQLAALAAPHVIFGETLMTREEENEQLDELGKIIGQFRCEMCGRFSAMSKAGEAEAEAAINGIDPKTSVLVCDDCYRLTPFWERNRLRRESDQ